MPTIHRCHPVFAVADPVASARHYETVFGFETVGEPAAEYAIVTRGGFEVHLHWVEAVPAIVTPEAPYRGGAYFHVDDPDALFQEMAARGAEVMHHPDDRPYGMHDFTVLDPDGYALCFGRPA